MPTRIFSFFKTATEVVNSDIDHSFNTRGNGKLYSHFEAVWLFSQA